MHPPDSFPGATDRTRATAPSGLPCIDSAGAALAERFHRIQRSQDKGYADGNCGSIK